MQLAHPLTRNSPIGLCPSWMRREGSKAHAACSPYLMLGTTSKMQASRTLFNKRSIKIVETPCFRHIFSYHQKYTTQSKTLNYLFLSITPSHLNSSTRFEHDFPSRHSPRSQGQSIHSHRWEFRHVSLPSLLSLRSPNRRSHQTTEATTL